MAMSLSYKKAKELAVMTAKQAITLNIYKYNKILWHQVFLGLEFNFIYGLNAVDTRHIYKRSLVYSQALQQCIACARISIKRREIR